MKPFTWSYSKLNVFNQCPHRYNQIHVARTIPFDDTETSKYGDRGHEAIDKHLKVDKPIPAEFDHIKQGVEKFKHIPGEVFTELKLAITKDYRPTEWLAPDVWGRAIIDAAWIDGENAMTVDWKFGKQRKDKENTQLKIGALTLFCHYPAVERNNTAFMWWQTGQLGTVEKYTREDIHWMWNEVMPDIRRVEVAHQNNLFPPKQSGLCNWCPVTSCQFWRSKDGTGDQRGRR